jgi:hypothetical protein
MKALLILPMMIVGLMVAVGMLVLRIVGLAAAIAGGFGLLAALGAAAVYRHAPTAAHWIALQHAGTFAATCLVVVIAAWFGPMWLFQENDTRLKR